MSLELVGASRVVDGQRHLDPIDLVLEAGTMNVLLGPTLSGKTTLMRMMAGLDVPSRGRILWQGRDVTGMRVQDRGVAMVYQQFINYPSMTVYENIASPLRILGRSRAEVDAAVRRAAGLMRLEPHLERRPLELSGGQQQRCALARALVKGAGLVLLDEPLANLDYKLREELRAEIPRIFEESGAIFVYATTEPEEALLLGGRTATLWEGRVTQFGPTAEVYRRPVDAVTARVFSDPPMNFVRMTKRGETVFFGSGIDHAAPASMRGLADGTYIAGFRPNHLAIDAPDPGAIRFDTVLGVSEITGSETFVHVDHYGDRWVGLVHGVRNLRSGAALPVHVDPRHLYVFAPEGPLVAQAPYAEAA